MLINKTILIIGIGLVVIIGGYFLLQRGYQAPQESETQTPTPSNEEIISMESGNFFFSPNVISAKVGETVTINITAKGQHTFTIDQLNVNVNVPNGRTTQVKFTPEQKGTFQFYCAIPGHRERGQIGTITVE